MPDPTPTPDPTLLATMRRLLASGDPYRQAGAYYGALRSAEAAADASWGRASGQPPRARTLLALRAAVELLEGLAVELTGAEQGGAPEDE